MLALDPRVARRPITVAEFLRMGEVGILSPRDRVELIEGELIAMAPIGANHAGTVNALFDALADTMRARAVVAPQDPVRLSEHNLPQPDYAVLVPRPDRYRTAHPRPHEVLLLIEVADSSLDYDPDVMPGNALHPQRVVHSP